MNPAARARRRRLLAAGLLAASLLAVPGLSAARSGLATPALQGKAFAARSIGVDDGDSFSVRRQDGSRLRIRIAGIDAPERSQPWSDVARRQLRALLDGQPLWLTPIKTDPWGRLVARVDADGNDVALAMLEAGLAWHFIRYDGDLPPLLRKRYAQAAGAARTQRSGLWQARDPEPPWEFRRRARQP
ncbi:MAG: thermonuclease family protein [Burkholderiaceae bacterium]